MSIPQNLDTTKNKDRDFRVHRYETVLVTMSDVSATSPEQAILAATPNFNKTSFSGMVGENIVSATHAESKPLSYIVEPIVDGLVDHRSSASYAEDVNGRIYQLPESLSLKEEDATRLVRRISDISVNALNVDNYESVLMAIIREARLIEQRHTGAKY